MSIIAYGNGAFTTGESSSLGTDSADVITIFVTDAVSKLS